MEIDNSVAIVTGGSSGLGNATAHMLAQHGAKVAIFDLDEPAGRATANAIGGLFYAIDVASAQAVHGAVEDVSLKWGAPRILFNCAGVAPAARTVGRKGPHDLELFEKVVRINLIGTFNCMRLVADRMAALEPLQDNERGVIVNTASVAAFDGQVGQAAYASSKAGVVGLTLPTARDLMAMGIRVCAIAPGIFETPMLAAMPKEVRQSLATSVPFPRRLGHPEEFARLGKEICQNVMLNGEVIRLDGAIRMAPS